MSWWRWLVWTVQSWRRTRHPQPDRRNPQTQQDEHERRWSP